MNRVKPSHPVKGRGPHVALRPSTRQSREPLEAAFTR
jgi:hypothetical protein